VPHAAIRHDHTVFGGQGSASTTTLARWAVVGIPLVAALLLIGACTRVGDAVPPGPSAAPTPSTSVTAAAWTPPAHWITVENGQFIDRRTGEVFVPRGVNYFNLVPLPGGWYEDRFFSPAVFDGDRIAADFATLAASGYNTVRLFLDSCGSGPDCVGGTGLNEAYLDVIAEVIAMAAEQDLVLLLTSNDLSDQGGYWALVDSATSEDFPGYRNSHVLTPQGHQATARYWDDLLSGLVQRRARFEAVLGWSLLNEQWLRHQPVVGGLARDRSAGR
jgi:hypothetical protein